MQITMAPPGSGGHAPAHDSSAAHGHGEEDDVIKPDIVAMNEYRSMKELAPDSPLVTLVKDVATLVVDLFKLSLASMLSVFVPQQCPGNEVLAGTGTDEHCTNDPLPHECSFRENFVCLNNFNAFVLGWNFISLILLIFHYIAMWRREKYIITHFRESNLVNRVYLKKIIHEYPTVNHKLYRLNNMVFYFTVACILAQVINLISSAILVFGEYYNGYKTVTTFFANFILITGALYNCITASYLGVKHSLAYSCVAFEPVSYNTVVDDYKGK